MSSPFGFLAIEIVPPARSPLPLRVKWLEALSQLMEAVTQGDPKNRTIWSGSELGGILAIEGATTFDELVEWIGQLHPWAEQTQMPLRLVAHCGAGIVLPVRNRSLILLDDFALLRELLQYAAPRRVVISDALVKQIATGTTVTALETTHPRRLDSDRFPNQHAWLLSLPGYFTSAWEPIFDERSELNRASAEQQHWRAIYHAKRIMQSTQREPALRDFFHQLTPAKLTYLRHDQQEEGNPLLSQVLPTDLEKLLRSAPLIQREAGEFLCHYNDPGDTMFIILTGRIGVVKVENLDRDSPNYMLPDYVWGPGSIIGELAYVLRGARTASLVALAPTSLLGFPYEEIRALCKQAKHKLLREAFDRFIRRRILQKLCEDIPYLGKNADSPLHSLKSPWDRLVDSSQLIEFAKIADFAQPQVLTSRKEFSKPGLYLLVSGQTEAIDFRNITIDSSRFPILSLTYPESQRLESRLPELHYRHVTELRVLRIAWEGFENLVADPMKMRSFHGIVRAAWDAQTTEWRSQGGTMRFDPERSEEFSPHGIRANYPMPIALAYSRIRLATNTVEQAKSLCNCLSATLRYLVGIGLADLMAAIENRQQWNDELFPTNKPVFEFLHAQRGVTLGRWKDALIDVARLLRKFDTRVLQEYPDLFESNSEAIQIIAQIIKQRNLSEHTRGDIPFSESDAATFLSENRPRLERLLAAIGFVQSYPMAFVTHDPTRTPKRHRVHSCIGVQISANSRHHFDLEPPVPEARPFLIAPDQRILCLWPFFTKHLCPDLGRSSIYVFEELSDKSRCLTSVQMACIETKHEVRQEWSKPQVDHLWLWEMRQEIPARRELTEKNLHEELMSRGSKLIGKEFSTPRLGRLRLLNCLSIGSLASVYLAQSDTGQQVAIKILENDPGLTDTDRQRFQQECETLTRLAHDHLVKCLDHGEAVFEQLMYHWYAMDVAEGNLAHRLRDRAREAKGVIPWNLPDFRKAIRSEFEAILDALIHLHLSKLMHRDIKPSNVLIFDKNRLRLSDLGLLKDHRRQNAISGYHSSLGSVLGTFDYMSPEQREAKQLDFSSDIFSMGILLAESAMGVRPTIDYQRKRGSAIQPTPAFDQLGKPLQTLLEKMTQVQKQNRPQDASELREAYLQHL